jgi:hypothetical protein
MSDCKPCSTPVDTHVKVSDDNGTTVSNVTTYRSLAGALCYLNFTWFDISYRVQQVCLHMHTPQEPHLTAAKRILCYLRGTLLRSYPISKLVIYTNIDWVVCPDTRMSTSGYTVFLGANLVSWSWKRQLVLSRSDVEVEYHVVTNEVVEASWLHQLL